MPMNAPSRVGRSAAACRAVLLLIVLLISPHDAFGCQPAPTSATVPSTATSARSLLHEAIVVISSRSWGRGRVDWAALERELAAGLPADAPPAAAHGAIAIAVARLNDHHARFAPPAEPRPAAAPRTPEAAPALPQEIKSPPPRLPTKPEAVMLPEKVAYVVIPGCNGPDTDSLRTFAHELSAELARMHEAAPASWLLDLRLNGGGNLWPMLLGLYPLLGDGDAMTSIENGAANAAYGVSRDAVWIDWGRGKESQLDWGDKKPAAGPIERPRVAVLIGPWTMSSGEAVAITFRGREAVRVFGEPTAGLTTVTNIFPLSDGSTLNLPVSRMGDRVGRAVDGPVVPDETVSFPGWPGPDDPAATAARAWLAVVKRE